MPRNVVHEKQSKKTKAKAEFSIANLSQTDIFHLRNGAEKKVTGIPPHALRKLKTEARQSL